MNVGVILFWESGDDAPRAVLTAQCNGVVGEPPTRSASTGQGVSLACEGAVALAPCLRDYATVRSGLGGE